MASIPGKHNVQVQYKPLTCSHFWGLGWNGLFNGRIAKQVSSLSCTDLWSQLWLEELKYSRTRYTKIWCYLVNSICDVVFSWFILNYQLCSTQLWLSLILPRLTKFLRVIPRNRPFRKHPLIPNHTSHSFCGNASEMVQAPTPVVKRQHKPVKNMYIHLPLASAIWGEVWTHLSCLQETDICKENS